ncbi:hypothetical protein F5Y14DRAFT_434459 [Nemania sp. NC0429]|nr:hypothetical protein F5Y14DRAFT_434459 [Nemania sp. NC0429]
MCLPLAVFLFSFSLYFSRGHDKESNTRLIPTSRTETLRRTMKMHVIGIYTRQLHGVEWLALDKVGKVLYYSSVAKNIK